MAYGVSATYSPLSALSSPYEVLPPLPSLSFRNLFMDAVCKAYEVSILADLVVKRNNDRTTLSVPYLRKYSLQKTKLCL